MMPPSVLEGFGIMILGVISLIALVVLLVLISGIKIVRQV
ncbi:MAG: hypothetical protein QOE79_1182 [Sphingomonadales bacterium]|nr:hypothetical protein [Sphingomonadales bacterium]